MELSLTHLHHLFLVASPEYPISGKPDNFPVTHQAPICDPATTIRFYAGPKPTHPRLGQYFCRLLHKSFPFPKTDRENPNNPLTQSQTLHLKDDDKTAYPIKIKLRRNFDD